MDGYFFYFYDALKGDSGEEREEREGRGGLERGNPLKKRNSKLWEDEHTSEYPDFVVVKKWCCQ